MNGRNWKRKRKIKKFLVVCDCQVNRKKVIIKIRYGIEKGGSHSEI